MGWHAGFAAYRPIFCAFGKHVLRTVSKSISYDSSLYYYGVVMYCNLPFGTLVKLTLQSKFKYRDRITIVTDILDAVSDDPQGKTKTGIMRSANLNFGQANKYLHLLELCDVLKAQDPLESFEVARYRLTGKGLEIARHLSALQYALEPLLVKPI